MKQAIKTRHEAPLAPELVDELLSFWKKIFGFDPDLTREVWLGSETQNHRLQVYLARHKERCVGSTVTITPHAFPGLGAVAQVATLPSSRDQGIASQLCRQAVSDFRKNNGRALFLGTDNPKAARIYYRLGWKNIAGTNAMVNASNNETLKTFMDDYFCWPNDFSIITTDPSVRIPMIPLLYAPHDWQVLDANVRIYSVRYHVQKSCVGLYHRYHHCTHGGHGQWFSAVTDDGRVVGFSTAKINTSGLCNIDGFTHQRFPDCWAPLIQTAIHWGEMQNTSGFTAILSVEDDDKRGLFESLGFGRQKAGEPLAFGGRYVPSLQLHRD